MSLKLRVVHVNGTIPYDVYIGRPSKWGNPFVIGKDGSRENVIELYRDWIFRQTELLNSLDEIRDKILGCWCAPKHCHGDVLVELCEATALYPDHHPQTAVANYRAGREVWDTNGDIW